MTLMLTGDYVLPAGRVLTSANEDGILITGADWFSLTLNGRLEVTNATYEYPVIAIRAGTDGLSTAPRAITVAATGSIKVTSTLPQDFASAIAAGGTSGQGIKLINLGTIEVTTAGEAWGVGPGSGGLENRGSMTVTSPGSAIGVYAQYGGSVFNAGSITVAGGSRAFEGAIGVLYRGIEPYTFNNSGVISVTSHDPAVGSSAVSISGYVNFVNSGLIEGATAIGLNRDGILSGDGRHSNIDNSGTLRGEVFLNNTTGEPVRLLNSGMIEGNVTLNNGNDTYSGVGGHLSGTLHGQAGADSILGGAGSETLSGDAGDDTIDGGAGGADVLDGGDGIDILSFAGSAAGVVLDVAGQDALHVAFRGFEQYVGSEHDDRIAGSAAADTLAGGGGADTVYGGLSNDSITDTAGANYLRGDEGDDVIRGGADFDDINGNMGNDTESGGAGEDWVVGGKDNDSLSGDAAHDLVYGNLGNDTCSGGDGNDIVRGGQDDDVCLGGAGDDFISGDRGADTMTGGAGADVFHTFGDAGVDRVIDFNVTEGDRVMLDPGTRYEVSQVGFDTVITMAGGGQMILAGVQLATLLTANWISVG